MTSDKSQVFEFNVKGIVEGDKEEIRQILHKIFWNFDPIKGFTVSVREIEKENKDV